MANDAKNSYAYEKIIKKFEGLSKGESVEDLEGTISKAYMMFINGYKSSVMPHLDFGAKLLNEIQSYCSLISRRKKVKIAGGEREIATEEEAYLSLVHAKNLANVLINLFHKKTDFLNKIFNDIYNLGLSYVDTITNCVADEYIRGENALEVKTKAVKIAKEGVRIGGLYDQLEFTKESSAKEIKNRLTMLDSYLSETSKKLIRSFENVPTTTKRIYHKEELTKKILEEISSFKPEVIFPIATGGTELGIKASNSYEKLGHSSLIYPLLFSMKTKKQRYPWVENDNDFLSKSLEGKNVLITEDWVTTGNTLRGILGEVEDTFPKEIRIATLKRDPELSQIPMLKNYHFYVGALARYMGDKTDSLKTL